MRCAMTYEDEREEFRLWQSIRKNQSPLEQSFERLERIIENPFTRGYDSAFRLMAQCLIELKREVERK